MANSPIDKGSDFIKSGMTLITEVESEKYLKKRQKSLQTENLHPPVDSDQENLYEIPDDRYSRPCGGANGFDDFVERWHE